MSTTHSIKRPHRVAAFFTNALLAIALATGFSQATTAQADDQKSTTTPVYRAGEWRGYGKQFDGNVRAISAQLNRGDAQIIFVGDSITNDFASKGGAVWNYYYAPRKAVNLGMSGDRTQSVLFRLDKLPLNKVTPKVAVVLIGVNNISSQYGGLSTPKDTADGIKAVVDRLQKQYSSIKVLVLAPFPVGNQPNFPDRKKIAEINSYLPKLFKGARNVTLLDIGKSFMDASGNISTTLMNDGLHPTPEGYKVWAKAMEPTLAKLFGDSPKPPMK